MLIRQLKLSNVRNIAYADLSLHPKLTIITGDNGAGKSSLLEALSLLANGKSFRTGKVAKVIQSNTDKLTVFAHGFIEDYPFQVGLSRSLSGDYKAKINGDICQKQYELTQLLPVFSIVPGFYDQISLQRQARLKLLDWGVFHVEHNFYSVWRDFNKVLKQRNALLKQIKYKGHGLKDLSYWDSLFCNTSEQLTELRLRYFKSISQLFENNQLDYSEFLQGIDMEYLTGSSKSSSLSEVLKNNQESDIQRGSTQSGPHRADFRLIKDKQNILETASRGQQKILINGVMLAMIQCFLMKNNKPCLICIDDLPSELDSSNQERLLKALMALEGAQIVLTAITQDSLPRAISGYNRQMFHVEHGQFQVQNSQQ
ncbi:DNA replication/repair protein RecF [Pleionea mediterranea]|uniref:DNA replication and repair protein RecF n=1 Tax=Pleionea mediterranea TaxID=523701 RepID=A0A316FD03_9GAMM|nr:DNA replication/repair protein RecF [Pleionea mediterranea]PWK46768.1 DNA replication and repair protein RecF [Pleionea mediterranea]